MSAVVDADVRGRGGGGGREKGPQACWLRRLVPDVGPGVHCTGESRTTTLGRSLVAVGERVGRETLGVGRGRASCVALNMALAMTLAVVLAWPWCLPWPWCGVLPVARGAACGITTYA